MQLFWIQKKPSIKRVFNVMLDPIPDELLDSGAIRFEGDYIVFDCLEAKDGYFTIKRSEDVYLAWESDKNLPNGYNIWHKRNAKDTLTKTDKGYMEIPKKVMACPVTDNVEDIPDFIKSVRCNDDGSYDAQCGEYTLHATPKNYLWLCYNYEDFLKGAEPEIGALEKETDSTRQYFVIPTSDKREEFELMKYWDAGFDMTRL